MEEKKLHCTLTDHELATKADQIIGELIKTGGKSFTMQVPARPNADSDLILAELNNRFKKMITQPAAAREEEAVIFAEWLAKEKFESVNGKTMRSSNWNAGMPYSPSELYELFKQQKEK